METKYWEDRLDLAAITKVNEILGGMLSGDDPDEAYDNLVYAGLTAEEASEFVRMSEEG